MQKRINLGATMNLRDEFELGVQPCGLAGATA